LNVTGNTLRRRLHPAAKADRECRRRCRPQEVYETERHLLYVACTRARDYLLVMGVNPASEFLDDLTG
jgi:ATP-dependent exoDNAse (exonuclease V) beta subunit